MSLHTVSAPEDEIVVKLDVNVLYLRSLNGCIVSDI
jgi:hypothetical protein